ncbi:MAG: hypothetical protein E7494_02310 [Ruminococcus albus]|jgi:hypothetical protein|nr:hypothetical protein [Ruminococcus albus]
MQKIKTRLFSLTAALLMVLTLFAYLPYGAISAYAQGSGTEKDPIIVTTYDELREAMDMSAETKAGTKRFVTLGSDIKSEDSQNDYNLLMISPVETEVTLDLNGHSISRICRSIDTAFIQLGESTGSDFDNCTLNIRDSKGGGNVYFKNNASSNNYIIMVWGGKLNIYGGYFSSEYRSDDVLHIMNGEINIYGGTFTSRKIVVQTEGGYLYIHNGIFNCTVGDNDRVPTGLYLSSNLGDFCIYNCTLNCTNENKDYFGKISVGGMEKASSGRLSAHLPPAVEVECDGVKQTNLDRYGFEGRKIVITDKTDYDVDIKITEPKQGATPSFKCTIDNPSVSLQPYMNPMQVFWHEIDENDNVHPMDENETFDLENYTYRCVTRLKSDSSGFFKKAKVTMNGKPCDVTSDTLVDKTVSLTFTNKKFIKGDVTGDGKITISDVAKVAAHIKGKKILTEEQQAIADIDGNGKITISDLTRIAAHVKGKKLIK